MASRETGFTLVELMIVVVIFGVLAAIAIPSYKRYMDANRTAEVMAMLGEIRTKEEAYRTEYNAYAPTNTSETSFYPALISGNEPTAKAWNTGSQPAGWTTLGLAPGRAQLYCGYVVIAGAAGSNTNVGTNGGKLFTTIYGSNTPTAAWWYVNATCDNDNKPTTNSTFTTGVATTTVIIQNEHQ